MASAARSLASRGLGAAAAAMLAVGTQVIIAREDQGSFEANAGAQAGGDAEGEAAEVRNWSDTHAVECGAFHLPGSREEVEALVKRAHEQGKRLRPCGNSISPNGGSFSRDGMICMKMCDRVKKVGCLRPLCQTGPWPRRRGHQSSFAGGNTSLCSFLSILHITRFLSLTALRPFAIL